MGKHRHKKSFYDVDEEDLKKFEEARRQDHHRHHRHHHRRRDESPDEEKQKKKHKKLKSFYSDPRIDDDQSALQSPPTALTPAMKNPSPSSVLSELIENPEFLTAAGPKAKEFVDTARQLLSKPDLDPTTQQIICAMAQAAVNVGKRLSLTSSNTRNQSVDELSVTNSATFSTTTLLSPASSNTSSSSTSNTPQLQLNDLNQREYSGTPTNTDDSEDLLIKQMIERAMKLTQQGDTKQAQHLLGIIHQKVSNKRKRTTEHEPINSDQQCTSPKKSSSTNEEEKETVASKSPVDNSKRKQELLVRSSGNSKFSFKLPNTSCPPPPPLPPPPPPPPKIEELVQTSLVNVPPIEQVQELLSNPSEVQSILKKMFAANEQYKLSPSEDYSYHQSSLTVAPPYSSNPNYVYYPVTAYGSVPVYPSATVSTMKQTPQPYNSSLAFLQGNRRNLLPIQTTDRCFSSENTTIMKGSLVLPTNSRSNAKISSKTSNSNQLKSSLANTIPVIASMTKTNSSFSTHPVTPSERGPSRWSSSSEQPNYSQPVTVETSSNVTAEHLKYHPSLWCQACNMGFIHQTAYQDHLRNHIPCTIAGCSYAATEPILRLHYQTIHEMKVNSRWNSHTTYPTVHQQQTMTDNTWPLTQI